MRDGNGFNKALGKINTDPNYSKILVKVLNPTTEEIVDGIIKSLGLEIISKNCPSRDWMVYTLNIKDMREVALILTEHGFSVEGINALPNRREVREKTLG